MTPELSPSQTPRRSRTPGQITSITDTNNDGKAQSHTRLGNTLSPSMDNERGRIRSSASPQPKRSNDAGDANDSHDPNHYQHGDHVMHDHGQGVAHQSQDSAQDQGHEHGLRVEKRRRTGGFLLPSALRHGSGTGTLKRHHHGKGKEKASAGGVGVANGSSIGSSAGTPGRSNGYGSMRSSPLAQVVVSPRPSFGLDGDAASRPSTEFSGRPTSEASSSQPRASSDYTLGPDGSMFSQHQQQGGGIDAAQIVNMALNLSEGRRRHMSAGQLLQQQAGGARRSTSVAMPSPMLQGSFQTAGAGGGRSLAQALQQHKPRSRTNSPGSTGKGTPKRHTSTALPFLSSDPAAGGYGGPDMFYRFSPSTLARAEKARQYIELSVEYRRLLDYLPPLRADASASGNYEYITHSVPGSPFVELVRSPTAGPRDRHELGRRYNPLQMIRNRKLRMRTRMEMKPDVEQFSDTNTVRDWIDEVQGMSSRPGYRTEDKVHLPLYPEHDQDEMQSVSSPGHHRNESTTKPKRQRSDWTFSPSEHLADAYWMEQSTNKRLIENHHGNKVLPPLTAAESIKPRASYESRRSHHSFRGSVGTSAGSYERPQHESDSDDQSVQGHRHRHHLHIHKRDESRGRLKHVWHKARRRSPSSSSNLSSSDEGPMGEHTKQKGSLRVTSGGHNISSLEKHLNSIMDKKAQDHSPVDLVSPGTPNKWGRSPQKVSALQREAAERNARQSDSDHVPSDSNVKDYGRNDDRLTPESAVDRGRRFGSRSSFEDFSTNPNSPVAKAKAPSPADLSPGQSRGTSPSRPLGKPLLPFIRKEQDKSQRKRSSNDDGYSSSRHTSAEVTSNPRGSLEVPRVVPATPERAKLHRHKTSDGLPTLSTTTTRDDVTSKEPQSAVRRFLKGGRIGEIVRNEGGIRGRKRGSVDNLVELGNNTESDTMEESDTEETDTNANYRDARPGTLQRTTTGWSQKYTSDKLPSFRSTKDKRNGEGRRGSDHITKQQRETQANRSSRLDTLMPPGLDLSRVESSSSNFADISRASTKTSDSPRAERRNAQGFAQHNRNRSRLGMRLEAILDVPGTVGSGGLPVTGLADVSNEKPPARPGLKDKRQWSISDRHRSQSRDPRAPALDYFEIARIRALLMCSGIKASTITYRGDQPRNPIPEFLVKAAATCHAELRPNSVKRSEEHVLAAKLLTTHLEKETSALHTSTDRFLHRNANSLKSTLTDMRDKVDTAIKTAQNLGDVCVGFGSEVTGQRTLQVRQVVDQLDKLARARRRRLRWLRRLGFGMGEWLVVLLLWSMWFLVVVIQTIWRVVSGIGRGIRWVLWL